MEPPTLTAKPRKAPNIDKVNIFSDLLSFFRLVSKHQEKYEVMYKCTMIQRFKKEIGMKRWMKVGRITEWLI